MTKRKSTAVAPLQAGKAVLQGMAAIPRRNDRYFDMWSLVHLSMGILLGWLMAPLVALALMVAWEPLEILVLSPLLARFGIVFGYESLRNSLSDIVFDALGIGLGWLVLTAVMQPPLHVF